MSRYTPYDCHRAAHIKHDCCGPHQSQAKNSTPCRPCKSKRLAPLAVAAAPAKTSAGLTTHQVLIVAIFRSIPSPSGAAGGGSVSAANCAVHNCSVFSTPPGTYITNFTVGAEAEAYIFPHHVIQTPPPPPFSLSPPRNASCSLEVHT